METPDIEKLAGLARIQLSESEKKALEKDFKDILAFIDQISGASVSHEEKQAGTPHNVMRPDMDAHEGGVYTDALLSAAPESKDGYVKVKNIF
ncbi:MAG: hypothetical protein AMXMBFR44_6640 [Candidatus Campbellbacteria bacterium]